MCIRDRCRADKAFIGVNGIDFTEGITGIGYPQMAVSYTHLDVYKRQDPDGPGGDLEE